MHTRQERADALAIITGDIEVALDHLDSLISDHENEDSAYGRLWARLDLAVRFLTNHAEFAEAAFDKAGNLGVDFPT